jgi:EAL and modified HD-GYP domain-containing signal transduction protein
MDTFVARQPIFDRKLGVFAYELLFRSGPDSCFPANTDIDYASSRTVSDVVSLIGLDTIVRGKRAFLNVSRHVLVNDLAMALPRNRVVIELLETVEPDDEVLAACRRLKKAGYLLALDDFVERPHDAALVAMADFVKVDFRSSTPASREQLARKFARRGIRMLAEKVETRDEMTTAMPAGYTYFQGYFFCRPTVVAAKDIPGFRLNYLRLLRELNRPDVNVHKLDEIIKQEVSIAFRVLRLVNSVAFGTRKRIESIREALVFLGLDIVRKWTSVWALAGLGRDKPAELVVNSVIRALCCERLASHAGLANRAPELFLLGMFSMLDAIMDRPMEEVLANIALADDVRSGLTGGEGPLRPVLDLVVAFERGDWNTCATLATELAVSEEDVATAFHDASRSATKVFLLA